MGAVPQATQNVAMHQQAVPTSPYVQNMGISMVSQRIQPIIPWNNASILSPPPPPDTPPRPPYFRTTVNQFPANKTILDNLGIPVSVVVSPAQVTDVPIIDVRSERISRCPKCYSYLSPFHNILQDNTATCPFCGSVVKAESSDRPNLSTRAETKVPVYDMVAPVSFVSLPDSGPSFVFIFDMTSDAIASGFTPQMITSTRSTLASMLDDTRIAVLTMGYGITALDFSTNSEIVIPDVNDIFVPRGCRANLGDVREAIDAYLQELLTRAGDPIKNCLLTAYQAAIEVMEGCGGVIVAGSYGISAYGPLAVAERKISATLPEAELLKMPKNETSDKIVKLSRKLNSGGFSVHLFVCQRPGENLELGSVTVPCGLTGGNCHLYTEFQQQQALDMHNDLFRTLTQEYFWDSSMRLRASNGIVVKNAIGNLVLSQETVFFPIMQGQSTVTFDLDINGEVSPAGALLQLAILWTNSQRQRMIRIFTFRLPICSDPRTIATGVDEAALATILLKYTASNLLRGGPTEAAGDIKKRISTMVSKGTPLVSLPYIMHSLLSSDIVKVPAPRGPDGRMATIIAIRACNVIETLLKLYPRFFSIEDPTQMLPLSQASFNNGTVFFFHTHKRVYIWANSNANPELLQDLFGTSDVTDLPVNVPQTGTPLNNTLNEIINECYNISGRYLPTEIISFNSPRQSIIPLLLFDDNTSCGANANTFIANFH